jgi:hypothetical protein
MSIQSFSNAQPRLVIKSDLVVIIVLTVFATALAPFIDEVQRNFLVIGVSSLMPLFLFAFGLPPKRDLIWIGAVILYIISLSILLGTTSDISSIAYTMLFILSYSFTVSCLTKGRITDKKIMLFLRRLILGFGAISVVQFLAESGGFPVPNEILSKGLWSHNSLAVEPSHLARVLCVSIVVYLVLRRTSQIKVISPLTLLFQERAVVGAFLTSILLSGSTLAAMAAPLALTLVFKLRWTMILMGFGVLLMPVAQGLEIATLQRGFAFVAAVPTIDIETLINADHSGSVRLMPALVYFNEIDPSSLEFWFGSGLSEISHFLAGKLPGVPEDFESGFFPGFSIAFGMVGFVLMIVAFVLRFLHPKTLAFILFWISLFFASPSNSQLFWYGLMMIRVLHHFEVEAKCKSKPNSLTTQQTIASMS